jgi:diguanylate cyclase with GGDEF domain
VLSCLGNLLNRQLLNRQLRTPALRARWRGEEFVIALPNTGGAQVLAERLRLAIERLPIVYEGTAIDMSVSLGVAASSPGRAWSRWWIGQTAPRTQPRRAGVIAWSWPMTAESSRQSSAGAPLRALPFR